MHGRRRAPTYRASAGPAARPDPGGAPQAVGPALGALPTPSPLGCAPVHPSAWRTPWALRCRAGWSARPSTWAIDGLTSSPTRQSTLNKRVRPACSWGAVDDALRVEIMVVFDGERGRPGVDHPHRCGRGTWDQRCWIVPSTSAHHPGVRELDPRAGPSCTAPWRSSGLAVSRRARCAWSSTSMFEASPSVAVVDRACRSPTLPVAAVRGGLQCQPPEMIRRRPESAGTRAATCWRYYAEDCLRYVCGRSRAAAVIIELQPVGVREARCDLRPPTWGVNWTALSIARSDSSAVALRDLPIETGADGRAMVTENEVEKATRRSRAGARDVLPSMPRRPPGRGPSDAPGSFHGALSRRADAGSGPAERSVALRGPLADRLPDKAE